jgi:acyl-CoA synthetase (AMP-forming)/AMP-acid ligase II
MSLVGHGTWRGTRDAEVALRDERDALTWEELDALLNRSTNALLSRSMGPHRRIAVFAENSITTVAAYLTGVLAGCSAVPINYHLRAEECAFILNDSDAALLFTGPESVEVALEAAALAGGIPVVAWGVDDDPRVERWQEFVASGRDEEPPDDLPPRPYLHYTSGTTGFPKGTDTPPGVYPGSEAPTIRTHVEALVAAVARDDGPWLTLGPMYHSGQVAAVKNTVLAGRPLVVRKRFDAEQVLATIDQYRIGGTLMVPTHFVRLLALPEDVRNRYDLSSMKRLSHVGAPCAVDVKRRIVDWWGPVVYEGYGATEQGVVSSITPHEWLAHPGSVGKVRDGLELHVIGEEGQELGPNQVGRLYFRDLSGFDVRFHNDAEETESVHLRPGVFTIGEVGYVDDDGYLYLTDRFSDMVISGGVNIYPAEAEQVMLELPGVADVACIGVPDDDLGEVLRALVVPSDPENLPSREDLVAQTHARLTRYKCPRTIEFVADLGRNPLGKLNKNDLRKRHESGEIEYLAVAGTTEAR